IEPLDGSTVLPRQLIEPHVDALRDEHHVGHPSEVWAEVRWFGIRPPSETHRLEKRLAGPRPPLVKPLPLLRLKVVHRRHRLPDGELVEPEGWTPIFLHVRELVEDRCGLIASRAEQEIHERFATGPEGGFTLEELTCDADEGSIAVTELLIPHDGVH